MAVMTTTIFRAGETLGGYRIDEVIGSGGMAVVYRAEQVSLGRKVALKVLAPELSADEAFRKRFRREGHDAALLDHPHVVAVHDSGESDGWLYLAMRLVEGGTLHERMRPHGLSADETVSILSPIADALDAAHAMGLVHRDVKPQNILIRADGHPYLADFGVAKNAAATLGLTATGGFVGTVNYASPEQILGRPTTAASDIYALTAVLYQCLTGQVPYPRDTDAAVVYAHVYDPPPVLLALAGQDADLDRVIARGMAKRPDERYGLAAQLVDEAAAAIGHFTAEQRRSVPAFKPSHGRASPGATHPDSTATVRSPDPRPSAHDDAARSVPSRASEGNGLTRPDSSTGIAWADRIRPRSRVRTARAAAALIAAVLVVCGLLFGVDASSGGVRSARTGSVTLSYPSSWRLASASTSVLAATAFRSPILLRSSQVSLAAGPLAESGSIPGGPPPQLVASFGQPASAHLAVVAGKKTQNYYWRSADGRQLSVLVVPTASSDLALACAAPGSSPGILKSCLGLAAGLTVSGIQLLAPGPDTATGVAIRSDLARVAAARNRLVVLC
ncbi:MAG: serine/threonine-protein kinase [Solirubrobacteraceae bacterium]